MTTLSPKQLMAKDAFSAGSHFNRASASAALYLRRAKSAHQPTFATDLKTQSAAQIALFPHLLRKNARDRSSPLTSQNLEIAVKQATWVISQVS
jgi:hypothetical protein